jgi:hypothetical protein
MEARSSLSIQEGSWPLSAEVTKPAARRSGRLAERRRLAAMEQTVRDLRQEAEHVRLDPRVTINSDRS